MILISNSIHGCRFFTGTGPDAYNQLIGQAGDRHQGADGAALMDTESVGTVSIQHADISRTYLNQIAWAGGAGDGKGVAFLHFIQWNGHEQLAILPYFRSLKGASAGLQELKYKESC